MRTIELRINGSKHRMEVEAGRTLLSVLRDELDLTA
jgi:aerobic-type carbon monoxide dehydrogenase small subunit (CoxS/CutS family)